jgi:hypothetical protein
MKAYYNPHTREFAVKISGKTGDSVIIRATPILSREELHTMYNVLGIGNYPILPHRKIEIERVTP